MPDPVLEIDGEYQIAVETEIDRCGFGTGSSSTPIDVTENGPNAASVNIPLGGAGGVCAPGPFERVGNLLSRSIVTQQSVGMCVVSVVSTTTLEFFADGSVLGSEGNTLTPVAGDCSAFGGECTVELSLTGAECLGCFDCVAAPTSRPSAIGSALSLFERRPT